MSNPAFDPRSTKPGSAGWYEPDGTYHPFNCDLEPDSEFAARVKDLGARSAIASLGGVIASASSTDQVRAAKSSIDALLYEMQHPKQELSRSGTVACAAGVTTAVSPWVDIRMYRKVGWWVLNNGAAVVSQIALEWAPDPNGGVLVAYELVAAAIAAGAVGYSQAGFTTVAAGGTQWRPAMDAYAVFPYFRVLVNSAIGTTAVGCVWGSR